MPELTASRYPPTPWIPISQTFRYKTIRCINRGKEKQTHFVDFVPWFCHNLLVLTLCLHSLVHLNGIANQLSVLIYRPVFRWCDYNLEISRRLRQISTVFCGKTSKGKTSTIFPLCIELLLIILHKRAAGYCFMLVRITISELSVHTEVEPSKRRWDLIRFHTTSFTVTIPGSPFPYGGA